MKFLSCALLFLAFLSGTLAHARPILLPDVVMGNPPFFPIKEWMNHTGGAKLEPYFLQDQLYHFDIELVAIPTNRDKVKALLKISDSQGAVLTESDIEIKLRGYTSMNFLKKQYGFTLLDKKGKEKDMSLLAMPAAEDWVISAPFNDKSLLRDILAYNVSNLLGRHAPRTRIISLTMHVLGQEPERMGIYVLTEKNTIGPGRIDIPKKNALGTSFLALFDHPHEGDNVVWRGRDTDLILDYPSPKKLTPAQTEEFLTIFHDVEARVTAASGESWDRIFDERLDLQSAVDFFVVQEFARNIDGFRLSSAIYIPPQGKVHFGPVWDFNIAFGNASHENGVQYDGWRALEKGVWFGALLKHPVFCRAVKERWTEGRLSGALSSDTAFDIIDRHAEIMAPLADENFAKWPSLGRYLWPNPYWLNTWDEEKDALKSWVSLRTQWLDQAVRELSCG